MKKSALFVAMSVLSAGLFMTYAFAGDGEAAPSSPGAAVQVAETGHDGACTVASGECTGGAAELKACDGKKEAGSCDKEKKSGCEKKGDESCDGKDKGDGCPKK